MADTIGVDVRLTAVITGASSGIGMATALEFARKGYDVVLAARRESELQDVAKECSDFGIEAQAVQTDVTDEAAIENLAQVAIERFGHIDVWVNTAGVYLAGKFEETPFEDMRRMFETNFFGYVYGSYAALRRFRQQGHGTLINVSSVNAAAPQPYISLYSASKAAVRALDDSLRMELRIDKLQHDISVCTVMPASSDTNLFQNGANFTSREVQALEPVYDPMYVAKQIVKLARHPKRQTIIGPAGKLMALQRAHFPKMYERQIARFTQKDLLGEPGAPITEGSLYDSISANRGMRGGWREHRVRADYLNAGIGLAAAGLLGVATLSTLLYRRHHAR